MPAGHAQARSDGTSRAAAGCQPMAKPHPTVLVLLVEDEPLVRMIASEGLEDAGFEVVQADNAGAAL